MRVRETDPVARKTAWTPLVRGGANFTTHRLVKQGARFVMKPTLVLKFVGGGFMTVGLSLFGVGLWSTSWVTPLIGAPMVLVGVYAMWARSLVFDGQARVYLGKRAPVPFSDIYALQLVHEDVAGGESTDFSSYELNLVLTDGSRINVVDHDNREQLTADARQLGALIGCAVWDATNER